MQQLLETRKENDNVRSSNQQLQAQLVEYKTKVNSLQSQSSKLQSHQNVAAETKLVTSKVPHLCSSGSCCSLQRCMSLASSIHMEILQNVCTCRSFKA